MTAFPLLDTTPFIDILPRSDNGQIQERPGCWLPLSDLF